MARQITIRRRHTLADIPTPTDIAAKCREIQAEWSEEERLKRSTRTHIGWKLPVVHVGSASLRQQ